MGLWRKGGFAVIVAAAAVGCSRDRAADRPVPPNVVRTTILSWNLGKVVLRPDSRAADEDLGHVAEIIQQYEPDFVTLQEIRDASQLGELLEELDGAYAGSLAAPEKRDRHVALLARRNGAEPRFETLMTSSGRSSVMVRMKLPDGTPLAVASVHLDAFHSGVRQREAAEIVKWASRRSGELFLAGDFNFDADAMADERRDSRDMETYRTVVRTFQDLGRWSGSTTLIGRRLDYIFARSSRLRSGHVQVLSDKRVNLMDHDPVLGTLDLDEQPSVM